jgi:hypothetical protein
MQQVRRFDWYPFRHFLVMPPFCRISSVPSTFLESVTTKAGTLKDDESPCVNPTRNSFLWFSSIVSYLFHDKCWLSQNTFPPARAQVLYLGYVTELQWLIALRTTGTCERSSFNCSILGLSCCQRKAFDSVALWLDVCYTSSLVCCMYPPWEWWLKSIVNLRRLKKWVARLRYAQVSEECCVPLILLREKRQAWKRTCCSWRTLPPMKNSAHWTFVPESWGRKCLVIWRATEYTRLVCTSSFWWSDSCVHTWPHEFCHEFTYHLSSSLCLFECRTMCDAIATDRGHVCRQIIIIQRKRVCRCSNRFTTKAWQQERFTFVTLLREGTVECLDWNEENNTLIAVTERDLETVWTKAVPEKRWSILISR